MIDPKAPHHYPTPVPAHPCTVNWVQRSNDNTKAWHYCSLESPHGGLCCCQCGSQFLPTINPGT